MINRIQIIVLLLFSISSTQIIAQNRIKISPEKARIYSAIIPGSGQFYTKKYWKIPLIYAGLIASSYHIKENHDLYSEYKNIYIRRTNGINNDRFINTYNNNEILNLTEYHKRNRDVSLLLFSLTYLLNIIDASVNAHLLNYDVNEDISLQVHPVYNTNSKFKGLTLSIKL